MLGQAAEVARGYGDSAPELDQIQGLIDTDLVVFFRNALQPPPRLRFTVAEVEECLTEAGFEKLERLNRYVRRENFRRFFAPLHTDRDSDLSRILYGEGSLEFLARKS